MAARALSFPGADIWDRFRSSAEHHVGEGNLEAGERLWEIVDSSEAALTIRSTSWTADAIECALDIESGKLTCAPGQAIPAAPLTFQVVRDRAGTFRRGGVEYTIDEAVNLILDELVWVDRS
jgi:hypothetical protein